MKRKQSLNTPLNEILDFIENSSIHGSRDRAIYSLRPAARVRDLGPLTVGDLITDGFINESIPTPDGTRIIHLNGDIQLEMSRYLCAKYRVKELALIPQHHTSDVLFPTQKKKREGFSTNTMAQNLCAIDARIAARFNPIKQPVFELTRLLADVRYSWMDAPTKTSLVESFKASFA